MVVRIYLQPKDSSWNIIRGLFGQQAQWWFVKIPYKVTGKIFQLLFCFQSSSQSPNIFSGFSFVFISVINTVFNTIVHQQNLETRIIQERFLFYRFWHKLLCNTEKWVFLKNTLNVILNFLKALACSLNGLFCSYY